jgi:DNA-binding transcriptional LysR family regulator
VKIEYLVEFADLAQTLSYVETTERLFLSESALSRHIKTLEEELGVPLFERTSRRVRLTTHGEALLPFAARVTAPWDEYLRILQAGKSKERSTIIVGTNYYASDLVAKFCAKHTGVSVEQVSDSGPKLLSQLLRGEYQFAVLIDPPPDDRIRSMVIAEDSYVAVLPARHALARKKIIDTAKLAGEHFISFRVGTESDLTLRKICRDAGFEPNVIFSADVGSSITQFVRDGLGVSILQRKTIAKHDTSGVAYVDLNPSVQISIRLCWRADADLSKAAQDFRVFAKSEAQAASGRFSE